MRSYWQVNRTLALVNMNALDPFKNQLGTFLKAIEMCISNKLIVPALANIYCLVDIFGWLSKEDGSIKSNRIDFMNWVNLFLLPDSNLPCRAIDLYAARCAVLHTGTGNSELIKNKKAKTICYCWGTCTTDELDKLIKSEQIRNKYSNPDYVVLHVNDLYQSLINGISKYQEYVFKDKERFNNFARRAVKTFNIINK
jgi:hypothetical protein